MIITELRGRLGNGLFQIAIGLYLSKLLNVEFAVKLNKENSRLYYYNNEIFPYEFFTNFNKLDLNYDLTSYNIISSNNKYTSYQLFPLEDNIVISGWFLGKDYINYNIIKDIYKPSKELKEELYDLYKPTRNSLMINVRRGDFLELKNINLGWVTNTKKYWENAYKYLNKKYDKVFVTSDDIEWCENNLDFCDNLIIVNKPTTHSKIFRDLFLPTLVGDNIISASTFSWWGAYLNQNPYKQVIMPYPWNTLKNNKRNKLYYFDNTIKFDIYDYKKID